MGAGESDVAPGEEQQHVADEDPDEAGDQGGHEVDTPLGHE